MLASSRIITDFVKEFWFSQIFLNDILHNFFILLVIDILCFVVKEPLEQIGGIFKNLLERFPRKLVIVAVVELSFGGIHDHDNEAGNFEGVVWGFCETFNYSYIFLLQTVNGFSGLKAKKMFSFLLFEL